MATKSDLLSVNYSGSGGPYIDADSVVWGIEIRAYDASYTHTLAVKRDSTTILTISLGTMQVGYNYKLVTLTAAQKTTILNAMSDVASFNATFVLTTLNNGTTVGTSSFQGNIAVGPNSYPTVNAFTYADTNPDTVALTGDNQTLVAGVSTIQLSNMSATAKNGATLSSFTIWTQNLSPSVRNISPSTTSYTYGLYDPRTVSDSDKLYLQVTDSRGINQSYGIDVNVIPYFAPSFTEYSIKRNGEDRTKANFVFSGSFATVLNNTVTLKYRYKEVGGSFGAYTTPALTISNGTFSYTATGVGSFDVDKSYEFEVVVTDILKSNTVSILLPTRDSLLSFRKNALGIGKTPSKDHTVEISDNYSLISAMPYVFSTNGGQTFSSFAYSPGYARIARVTFTSAPAQTLGPSSGVIRFRIESSRQAEATLTMMFNMYPSNISDMYLGSFYRLYYAQVPGSSYGDTSFFVQLVTPGTYDFYAQLNDTYDKLTVCTYIQELLKEYVQVTYEDAYIATASRPAASSTVKYGEEQGFGNLTATGSLVANGKNNVMGYMPYSWNADGGGSGSGYARIATITITNVYANIPIEFTIVRRRQAKPMSLFVSFVNENSTDPALNAIYYEGDSPLMTNSTVFEAFIYKTATSIWDVYVRKAEANDAISVWTNMGWYAQNHCSITYSQNLLASVPSGATMATPVPPPSLGVGNPQMVRFNVANGSPKRITASSECALLISSTGWSQNIRSGLWFIAGYSDSSRADITTLKTASGITITAVSGALAWTITNTQSNTTADITVLVLWGAMPTVT